MSLYDSREKSLAREACVRHLDPKRVHELAWSKHDTAARDKAMAAFLQPWYTYKNLQLYGHEIVVHNELSVCKYKALYKNLVYKIKLNLIKFILKG